MALRRLRAFSRGRAHPAELCSAHQRPFPVLPQPTSARPAGMQRQVEIGTTENSPSGGQNPKFFKVEEVSNRCVDRNSKNAQQQNASQGCAEVLRTRSWM